MLFFLIGAPLLVLTLVLSAGFAVAAVAGLGAAVVIQHKRGRRYSLLSGWIGAVVGFALVSGAFTAYKVAGHSDTLTMAIDSARTQAATQPPPKLPGFLQRLQPNTTVDSATQARARAMTQSRGFVWFSLVFGGGIVLVIASTFAGTATWGFVTLLGYSFTGLWPPGTARPAEEVVDFG
ncbi:MAG TPA: hypothetical protein VFK13_10360 [Gemmatimonadaceae bacterium]|nr:hypothetical protein [Gemmatimonadaceae bacterium]